MTSGSSVKVILYAFFHVAFYGSAIQKKESAMTFSDLRLVADNHWHRQQRTQR